ncbi:hypothetical protein [Streptomyces hirsutus]|uniref:hypothetical protein n=1 Tax=Streptomyces hirsutus TaxID=35620 RepID=UPI0036B3D169
MNSISMQLSEGELSFESDGQWITSNLPQPDPKWKATDKQGHEHHYAEGPDRYPTLTAVSGEPYWCDDCCDDEHRDTWYECRQCGERITPGTYVDSSPRYISGPARYYWNGEPISVEKANEIIVEMQRIRDEAMRLKTRPAIGTQVRLMDTTVTVMPTDDSTPATHVTVMHHSTGATETVALTQLRRRTIM